MSDRKINTHNTRKKDHLELAKYAKVGENQRDLRFTYEPILGNHTSDIDLKTKFLGRNMRYPIWISSMTGGGDNTKIINQRLAKVAKKHGLGIGLGSIRPLLENDDCYEDYNLRGLLGDDVPFCVNLGIAQLEEIFSRSEDCKLNEIFKRLQVDGLIIHVNPLQELLQPEGDRFGFDSLEVIKKAIELISFPIIVKEVGQGFGPNSLKLLMELPLIAIELAAFGGTNFPKLEGIRSGDIRSETLLPLAHVGQTAIEMINIANSIVEERGNKKCPSLILSGGVRTFLDGYYLLEKFKGHGIYGMAASFLDYAILGEQELDQFVSAHIEGLEMAHRYLRVI